jgi:predicted RNA-binding Zn ribbon-like protein
METAKQDLAGQVERMIAFLNSRGVGYETGTDHFSSMQAAVTFLTPTFGARTHIPPRTLNDLKRLRQALLELISTAWRKRSAANALNEIAAKIPYRIEFHSEQEALIQPMATLSVFGIILRDVADLIESGQWDRVKFCSNEACSAAFFDRSRNKTQRWHSFDTCGNKHNVAAYRTRVSSGTQD